MPYSGSPAARTSRPTTRSTTPASATSSAATSRARATRPRATRRRPARSASRSRPPAPARPTSSRAIADAMLDSVPTVFITGQVRTDLIGTDGFQEADTIGHHDAGRQALLPGARPARDPAHDPRGLPRRPHRPARARCWSTSRRTSRAPTSRTTRREAPKVDLPGYKNFDEGNAKQIRLAAKALANARRPIIYAGGGVVNGNAADGADRARR